MSESERQAFSTRAAGCKRIVAVLAIALTIAAEGVGQSSRWVGEAPGNLLDPSNWSNGVPNGAGAVARFWGENPVHEGDFTIGSSEDDEWIVDEIDYRNDANRSIAGPGRLVMQARPNSDYALILQPHPSGSLGFNMAELRLNSTTRFILKCGWVVNLDAKVTGPGGIDKSGGRHFHLRGDNTYTGPTTIRENSIWTWSPTALGDNSAVHIHSGGILRVRTPILHIGSLSGDGEVWLWQRGHNLYVGGNDRSTTFSGSLIRPGRLNKVGKGTLALTGDNTYTGGTTIEDGALQIGDGGETGGIVGSVVNNSRLIFNRAGSVTFPGVISGSGDLIKVGPGSLKLSGVNTYSGATEIRRGMLQLTESNRLPADTPVTIDRGVIELNGDDQTFGSLAGRGTVWLARGNLTVGGNDLSTEFIGSIGGAGGLTKTGAGVLTLAGANGYRGDTHVTGGTLRLAGDDRLPRSTTVTLADATLDLNGHDQTIGSLSGNGTVATADGTLVFGSDGRSTAYAGALVGPGELVKTGGGEFAITGAVGYKGELVVDGGAVRIADGSKVVTTRSTLGKQPGADGQLSVQGAGTRWKSDSSMGVGIYGAGTLTVADGGKVFNEYGSLGLRSDARGAATVSGADALWQCSRNLSVGFQGVGELKIVDGGTVECHNGFVARHPPSKGNSALVRGEGSQWKSVLGLYVGGNEEAAGGSGTLTVADGAVAAAGQDMRVWEPDHATVAVQAGGRLTVAGTLTNSGIIEIDADGSVDVGSAVNTGTIVNRGTLTGPVAVSEGGVLSGNGVINGTIAVADGGTLSPGAETMSGAECVFGSGGVFVLEAGDAQAIAGGQSGCSLLSLSGELLIEATEANPFVIDIASAVPSLLSGAVEGVGRWKFVTAAGGISGFSQDRFRIHGGNAFGGSLFIDQVGDELFLSYSAD